ncbi:uncharacterized protein [Watersipora subatra]|uniref:uncharacterized protein n=1 Tax=Watersipora subatra TaxID=2589382 RepID=UPI00355AEF20
MADMKEIVPPAVECGFCLRQGVALPNPRQLTCNHVHCLECLTGFNDENNIIVCPWEDCRVVCEVPLDKLPSYDVTKDKPRSCDPCAKKGKYGQHAFSYCPRCDKILCAQHHESHREYQEDFGEPHPTINMEQYELLKSQQSRVCADHDNKPISMGCRKCLKMSCPGCVSSMGTCSEGAHHQLMSLEELVLLLNDEINKLKKEMIEKEESLERIFKFTSQTLAEYDLETAQSVEKIHKKRDEQMKLLSLKYKQLEEDFQKARLKTKTCITDFLEDKILVKWSQLRNLRHKVDSRAQHAHQCDIVSSYSDTKRTIEQLVDEALPSIDIPSLSKVKDRCGSCEIMLEVVSTDGFSIDEQLKLPPSNPLPKSLKHLHTVSLPSHPCSTKVWNSQILTGMVNNAVVTIDNNYQVKGSFITFNSYPKAMEVYKDRLYTAVYANPWTIYVHDQQGKQVTSWSHSDYAGAYSITGLAITCDKIVAPDRKNKLLIIYSLTGNKLKDISCPQLSQNWVSLCVSGLDKVVVSDYGSSQVCLIDISQGQLLWTWKDVSRPLGVACYGERYVLVAASNSSTVRVLDSSTGKVVSKLTDRAIESSGVYDMDIPGDRLIVANYNSRKIAVFQLQP